MVNTKKESIFLCSYKTGLPQKICYLEEHSLSNQLHHHWDLFQISQNKVIISIANLQKWDDTLLQGNISIFPRSLIPSSLIPINTPDWSRHCKSKVSHPGKGTDSYLLTRSVIWNFNKKWGIEQKKLFCWYQSSGNGRLPFYGQQRYIVKCTYRRESCSTAHLPHLVQLGTSFFPHLSCEKPNSKINKEVLLINLFCTIHTKVWLY